MNTVEAITKARAMVGERKLRALALHELKTNDLIESIASAYGKRAPFYRQAFAMEVAVRKLLNI
jgi:hypothetical protein